MRKMWTTLRTKNLFASEVKQEVSNIVDQCCLLVARAEQSNFGHVAEHLTGLRKVSTLYVRSLSGIQRQWQMPCLVIATIDVNPAYHRQGIFKALLAELLKVCNDNQWVLKFENVLVDHLRDYLTAQGFQPAPDARGTELLHGSMYWMPNPSLRGQIPQFDMTSVRGGVR